MTVVGYARTSTTDQVAGLEDQLAELKRAGCERVFAEHVSAFDASRPELEACLAWVREGDTLVVTKPDRLARSVTGLLEVADSLKARSVGLRLLSLDIDTSNASGRLTLTILAAVAAWERDIMLERQRAGIAKAKAEGKYRGRPAMASSKRQQVLTLISKGAGDIQIAREVGLDRTTVYRIRHNKPHKSA